MPNQKLAERRQARLAMVEKYLASGQPQKQFCQNEQINYVTFRYWLKKYRQEQVKSVCGEPSQNRFVPLTFSPGDVPQRIPCYTVEYPAGVVLHITTSIDPQSLIQLIRAQDV